MDNETIFEYQGQEYVMTHSIKHVLVVRNADGKPMMPIERDFVGAYLDGHFNRSPVEIQLELA